MTQQYEPGNEIVAAQNPQALDEARRFAAVWIDSAAMFARNADYWRERAMKAEHEPDAHPDDPDEDIDVPEENSGLGDEELEPVEPEAEPE